MLNRTADTTVTMENLEPGSTHSYIVQPISYVETADNVSPEYRVTATCGQNGQEDMILLEETDTVAVEESASSPENSALLFLVGCATVVGTIAAIVIFIQKQRR